MLGTEARQSIRKRSSVPEKPQKRPFSGLGPSREDQTHLWTKDRAELRAGSALKPVPGPPSESSPNDFRSRKIG